MRSIRGYILNLFDGLGPPPGTVQINARPVATPDTELALSAHRLGALNQVHLPLSGSATLADTTGHFGWDMELNPGPINIKVNPQSPSPGEVRRRFPDETAQIGKGFISDIERLGWAGGKDHLIWDAVYDGHNPTAAQWSTDPAVSWSMGNGSISSFGAGVDAGRVTIRKFIAMLGGVPFSVEMGDLKLPVSGETARPANAGPGDRWDLLCATIDWNPASATYGKQGFEFTPGIPGGSVPPMVPNHTDQYRRLPLFALKMAAGASVYGPTATDLRPWAPGSQPTGVATGSVTKTWQFIPAPSVQTLAIGWNESVLNTIFASDEAILAPGVAWDGFVQWAAIMPWNPGLTDLRLEVSTSGRRQAADGAIAGTNYVVMPANDQLRLVFPNYSGQGLEINSYTFPLSRIPAFPSGGTTPRDWARLRLSVRYYLGAGTCNVVTQNASLMLWPVP